jgi:hypothetical protein
MSTIGSRTNVTMIGIEAIKTAPDFVSSGRERYKKSIKN